MERIFFFMLRLERKTDQFLVRSLALSQSFGDIRCLFERKKES